MRCAACCADRFGVKLSRLAIKAGPPKNTVTAPPGTGAPGQNAVSPRAIPSAERAGVPGIVNADKIAASSNARLPAVVGAGIAVCAILRS